MKLCEAIAASADHLADGFYASSGRESPDMEIVVLPYGERGGTWGIKVFDPEEGEVAECAPLTLEEIERDWPYVSWHPLARDMLSVEEREDWLDTGNTSGE